MQGLGKIHSVLLLAALKLGKLKNPYMVVVGFSPQGQEGPFLSTSKQGQSGLVIFIYFIHLIFNIFDLNV